MLWFGNFNRHHPLWEEDKNRRLFSPPHLIDPLIDTIQEFDMILALPPGIPTYKSMECPAACLRCKEDINTAADSLVNAINKALKEMVPISKPSPYARHWRTRELTKLKKVKNRLSNISYKLCGIPEAPAHAQHKELHEPPNQEIIGLFLAGKHTGPRLDDLYILTLGVE